MTITPLIIGHRGASGQRPEHTLEAYSLAMDQGADFIEPDLVSTKDGILIARHENEISETTDVAVKFPKRKTTKTIDGHRVTGWFTEDFTLKEIETLRAKERLPQRDQSYNGKFQIPTFQEILELVKKRNSELGRTRPIGIYPETKHSTHFRDLGLPLEPGLLKLLTQFGYTQKTSPVFIQSFETTNLKELRKKTELRLVQLLDDPDLSPFDLVKLGIQKTYRDLSSSQGLKEISSYADGVGPYKRYILPVDPQGNLQPPTDFVTRAHAVGLQVHTWTLRGEKDFLHPSYQGSFEAEFHALFKAGVDAVFTDFPGAGVEALKNFKRE